jgi:hypothetical protein
LGFPAWFCRVVILDMLGQDCGGFLGGLGKGRRGGYQAGVGVALVAGDVVALWYWWAYCDDVRVAEDVRVALLVGGIVG